MNTVKRIYCKETKEVFNSIKETAKCLGLHTASIGRVLKGTQEKTKGYSLRYATVKEIKESINPLKGFIFIKGYETLYCISRKGDIYSWTKNNFLNKSKQRDGYMQVCLTKNGQPKGITVHRLVALTYLKKPNGKYEVNHKNGIKADNRVENLEWVTRRDNLIHAKETGLCNHDHFTKSVRCLDTNEVFKSTVEAAKKLGINKSGISLVATGKLKTTGGYRFKYV